MLLRGGPRADYDAGAAADTGTDYGIARRVRQSGEFPILREWCFFSRCRVDEPPPAARKYIPCIGKLSSLSPYFARTNVRAFYTGTNVGDNDGNLQRRDPLPERITVSGRKIRV